MKEKVKKAFKSSDLVVMELNMADPNLQTEMMKVSMILGDDVLQNHMTDEEYKMLDEYFTKKMGIGMAQLNKMKPFVVSSMLLMAYLGNDRASYEGSFVSMAKENAKEVKGLETVDFQMGIFDGQSYKDQIATMITMLTTEDGIGGYFDQMVQVYKTENIDKIYKLTVELLDYDEAMRNKLLDERNQNWIPKIEEFSKGQEVFYAVGAAHLGGKQGVINLLKKAGYIVTPVLN